MEALNRIIVVDPDIRRRAATVSQLSGLCHAEPYESAEELRAYLPEGPSLLLVHCAFDDQALVQTIRFMDETGQWMPLVAYGDRPHSHEVVDAIHLGAIDFWEPPLIPRELKPRLAEVLARSQRSLQKRSARASAILQLSALSVREREVIDRIATGCTSKQIAMELSISPRTVEVHRANMMNKIGAASVSEVVRLSIQAAAI